MRIVPSNAEALPPCEVLIALHARRSAQAIRLYRQRREQGGLILALTGTDVYRDIHEDPAAKTSLAWADRLIVLQPAALDELVPEHRLRTTVIYQSARLLKPGRRNRTHFDIVQVGHLRAEKDPFTPITALRHLPADSRIRLTQIGDALDAEHRATMQVMLAEEPRLDWLGVLSHGATRQRIKRAHLLVLASRMEGGAHVLIEAIRSGVPVLASRVSGNLGMLGEDYPGYFPCGDAHACAEQMWRAERDPVFYASLLRHAERRSHLFEPAREASQLRRIVRELLVQSCNNSV